MKSLYQRMVKEPLKYIKKCDKEECHFCTDNPARLELHWLPDPVVDTNANQELPYPVYKKFQDVYGQPTTAKDRPSKQSEQQTSEADLKRKAHLVAGKVRSYIECTECGKRRCVYSPKTLQLVQIKALEEVEKSEDYMTVWFMAFPT